MDYHEVFDEPSSSRRSRHYHSSSSSSTWTTTLASWLDLLTGPNFGIFVAVIVVILMQYQKGRFRLYNYLYYGNFYYYWQHPDGWQGIVDVLFRSKETMRAYYQMACEFVRTWRYEQQRTGTGLSLLRTTSSSTVPPPLVLPEEEEEVPSATNGKHRKHRHRLSLATTTKSNGNHMQNSSSSSSILPELDPSAAPLLQKKKNGVVCQQTRHYEPPQDDIEPAFLNEQDYPPGWLVYHPVLGVVPKEQADQYDKSHNGLGGMPIILSSSIYA
jgi:hypothetical protein